MIQKKVGMLGAFAVGKTSLVARFVRSIYSETYQTTIGVKVDKKDVVVDGTPLGLLLWDLHGEDELQKVRLVYLRGASGYLLVADGTRAATLEVAQRLQQQITATLGPLPFVLVLNKADRADDWEITPAQVEALRQKGWPVLKTSARTGAAVEEAFLLLARLMQKGAHG